MTPAEIQAARTEQANTDLAEAINELTQAKLKLVARRKELHSAEVRFNAAVYSLESLVNDCDGSPDVFGEAVALLNELKGNEPQ